MSRPVTIFTGQWADLKCEDMCKLTHELGYDGIELACWGDHFEIDKASSDSSYCADKRDLLAKHDLEALRSRPTLLVKPCATTSTSDTSRFCPTTFGGMGIRKVCVSVPLMK